MMGDFMHSSSCTVGDCLSAYLIYILCHPWDAQLALPVMPLRKSRIIGKGESG